MAKLSQTEKYTIQGMLHNSKSIPEIAEQLGRSEKCISNYVDGELDKIHTTIAKIETAKVVVEEDPVLEPTPPKPPKPETIIKLPRGQGKRSFARKSGAVVMTPAASEVGDDFLKQMPKTVARTAKGQIYDCEGNKKE